MGIRINEVGVAGGEERVGGKVTRKEDWRRKRAGALRHVAEGVAARGRATSQRSGRSFGLEVGQVGYIRIVQQSTPNNTFHFSSIVTSTQRCTFGRMGRTATGLVVSLGVPSCLDISLSVLLCRLMRPVSSHTGVKDSPASPRGHYNLDQWS